MRPIPNERFTFLAAPITISWKQLHYLLDLPSGLVRGQRLLAVGEDGSLLVQAINPEGNAMEGTEVWIDTNGEEIHPG